MENFNAGWEFTLNDDWKPVQLPHDWLIKDVRNLYKNGVGCYRKKYMYKALTKGERLFLRFDGVYQDSTLFVNGQKAGEWKNGYTAFSHEITKFLKLGENEILIKVKYESPNTRWYSGAGIYRDCFLVRKEAPHFTLDGIYVSTDKVKSKEWLLEIHSELRCAGFAWDIRHSFSDDLYTELLDDKHIDKKVYTVKSPRLWDINDPACYALKSELLIEGTVVDTVFTRFGFREIAFSPSKGFFLNKRQVQLNGVCHHHDCGALGAAVHKDAIRRQLEILRGMEVNAIRTAHNPPAAVFMELCDEMGFLVMSEFTDVWKRPKTKFDYARFFEDWAKRDVAAWVRRDRNCPSIIMWSVGNEIYDTHADYEDGASTLKFLMKEVRRHDPKGNAELTLCSNYMPWENTQKCAGIIKKIGYNYADHLYKEHHKAHPDWFIYGGETASTVQSRGVYHFPLKTALLSDDDLQCSALGNSSTSWGAKSTEAVIRAHIGTPGQFIWTGFDYIGEPTPYHTKNSYFGAIDTAGFLKDCYYIYKAAWSDSKNPVLHLYPYWDWSPGQPIDIRIASNAPKTKLFLNGKPLGFGKAGRDFIVPYEPGCLKAVAYDENGIIVSECERHSFGDAIKPVTKCNQLGELLFAEISAVDSTGSFVENANNRVTVTVKNGELLGLDNGDSTDYDQYQDTNSRRLFNGKLLAIVKPTGDMKQIEIIPEFDSSDIPIRKIELLRDDFTITAKLHPANVTYRDLHWRLTDSAGIDSSLGRLTISGETATLQPKGDGEVYVRCATKNGKEHISLISVLPIEITDYGKPFLDPYSFMSGGLYNLGNNTVNNGNERGIATARDQESTFGFAGLDFGAFGADEITLWLFPLSGEPFEFEIIAVQNEEQILHETLFYDKGTVWNTYQAVTYKLSEKLRGIVSLSFIFRQKVHVKGFRFKSKTYEQIPFASCDSIYGDSYTIANKAIENIGNNVTISFIGFNFEEPTAKLNLLWRSLLDKNTIRLTFTNEDGGETTNTLELPASENYSTAVLNLQNPLHGKGNISFVFLPGAEIDLKFFQFLL